MTGPRRYLSKAIAVEAMELTRETAMDLLRWCGALEIRVQVEDYADRHMVEIEMRDGPTLYCTFGDVIVNDTGAFYVLAPGVFATKYEPMDSMGSGST